MTNANILNVNSRIVNGANRPLSSTLANHVFYYPTPSHLNYNWSFGSLVGLFFALQIVTGIFLAMHYTPHVEWAFASVEHIMTDVNGGQFFRYFHANGASAVFILMYAHIARNLYYQSYLTRRNLWYTGLVIFLLIMATAFIGYVLPWGQISFWGATVITSLVTAVPLVGEDIAYWVWGGFSINNATLTRFFSLHYLLPFLITGIIGLHLVLLHTTGSSDPLTLPASPDKLTFHPYFTYKDAFIFLAIFAAFGALTHYFPNLLGHSDNFLPANPLVTPAHIVPEWYFTPFYAILRACPNKLGGAVGMFAAIILLFFVPRYIDARTTSKLVFAPYSLEHKIAFWGFAAVFGVLLFLGSRPAAAPYVLASKLFTFLYFAYFLLVLPALAFLGEILVEERRISGKSRNVSATNQKSAVHLFKSIDGSHSAMSFAVFGLPTEIIYSVAVAIAFLLVLLIVVGYCRPWFGFTEPKSPVPFYYISSPKMLHYLNFSWNAVTIVVYTIFIFAGVTYILEFGDTMGLWWFDTKGLLVIRNHATSSGVVLFLLLLLIAPGLLIYALKRAALTYFTFWEKIYKDQCPFPGDFDYCYGGVPLNNWCSPYNYHYSRRHDMIVWQILSNICCNIVGDLEGYDRVTQEHVYEIVQRARKLPKFKNLDSGAWCVVDCWVVSFELHFNSHQHLRKVPALTDDQLTELLTEFVPSRYPNGKLWLSVTSIRKT